MSDLDRVRGWFRTGTLLPPSADVANTVDLARALAHLAGVPDVELAAGGAQIAERIGGADHYVFVLVDGLGLDLVEGLPPQAFLRQHLALELRAVFPASTAPALTSLATGLWPARHAALAWWTYLPAHGLTATVLPFEERFSKRPLGELGVASTHVFPEPSLLPRFRHTVRCFVPEQIADTTYTRYFCGPDRVCGYETLAGAVDAVVEHVSSAPHPTYSYLYYSPLDATQHAVGPAGQAARAELSRIDGELGRLARDLAGRARLAVSSDHGVIAVEPDGKHALLPDDELVTCLLAPPAGEPRVPLLHARPGCAGELQARFRERYGEAFALISIEEAEELALFGPGPLSAEARARAGQFVAIAGGPHVLIYRAGAAASPVMEMRGFHAGLSPAEMRVPLVVA